MSSPSSVLSLKNRNTKTGNKQRDKKNATLAARWRHITRGADSETHFAAVDSLLVHDNANPGERPKPVKVKRGPLKKPGDAEIARWACVGPVLC
jgi:hypothetical protein